MSYNYFPGDDDKPMIVLLHGFVSSKNYWRKVIPFLQKEGYGVLCIDLVGFGQARHIKADTYTYDLQIAHIISCLESANVKKPFILAGHSMGALISAYFTSNYPHKVMRLLMFNPPLYRTSAQALSTLQSTSSLYRFLLGSRGRGILWGLMKLLPNTIQNHSAIAREQSLQNIVLSDDNFCLVTTPRVYSFLIVGQGDRPIYRKNLAYVRKHPLLEVSVVNTNHHTPRVNPGLTSEFIMMAHKA